MKKRNNQILGVLLILIGGLFLLQATGVINNFLFDGWWTLFLIIPGLLSMSRQGITVGNTILVLIGVLFLLDEQGIALRGYLVPAVLIALGLAVIFRK